MGPFLRVFPRFLPVTFHYSGGGCMPLETNVPLAGDRGPCWTCAAIRQVRYLTFAPMRGIGPCPTLHVVGADQTAAAGETAKGAVDVKLVTAIVRPEKLDDLVDELAGNGAPGLTVTEIRGFGRQYGQLAASWAAAGGTSAGIKEKPAAVLLGKIRLDILVLDDDAESMVEVIEKSAHTGTIGDGKVWVTPVESALRVRTGERGRDAV